MRLQDRSLGALVALLALTALPSARPSPIADLGDAMGELPKRAYAPTDAEKTEDADAYRFGPGDGKKVTDFQKGGLRNPTTEEAKVAVEHSVDYHGKLKATLDKLATGDVSGLKAETPENEQVLGQWKSLAAQKKEPAQPDPTPPPQKQGVMYDARQIDAPHLPRFEPIQTASLNGQDRVMMLPPVVHTPEFSDCNAGVGYSEHIGQDTFPIMEEADNIFPSREGNERERETCVCKTRCNDDSDCLGYVETFLKSECWLIPKAKFPDGKIVMQDWNMGATFVKLPLSPPPPGCDTPADQRVLPQTDFGSAYTPVSTLTPTEEKFLKSHQEAFLSSEMSGLGSNPPEEAAMERKAKASAYYDERKQKAIQGHNAVLEKQAERAKKALMLKAIEAQTAAERVAKTRELATERASKKAESDAKGAVKQKERAFKQTPEGVIEQDQITAAKETAHQAQEADANIERALNNVAREKALEKEAKHVAEVAAQVEAAKKVIASHNEATTANNGIETKIVPGDDVYKAMALLANEGVPY